MDVTPRMLEVCREQFPQGRWVSGSIEAIPFGDDSFDVVYCRHVLEHLENYERAIDEMKRVGRKVVIVLLRRLGPQKTVSIGHGAFDNTYDDRLLTHLGEHERYDFDEQEILVWSAPD